MVSELEEAIKSNTIRDMLATSVSRERITTELFKILSILFLVVDRLFFQDENPVEGLKMIHKCGLHYPIFQCAPNSHYSGSKQLFFFLIVQDFWTNKTSDLALFCIENIFTTEFVIAKHLFVLSCFLLPTVNLQFTEDTNEIVLVFPISKFHLVNYWKVRIICYNRLKCG